MHLCFGYAALVRPQKPSGYSFLPELADSIAEQISIEAAQPRLDLGVLNDLAGKTIISASSISAIRRSRPPTRRAAHPRRADYLPPIG